MKTLLIANRAEIAVRIMRSAKARGLTTVAVFSDADAGSPHVAAADLAVRLPGVSATETYLNEAAIIAAAVATGADAIHPGYGFLAERASFARACHAAQITFVGPSPEVIATMGSKVDAKALMATNQVPVLPGALVDPAASDADIIASADVIGTPLLVKASFGGGGRGMRIVRDLRELPDAVRSAARDADAAFGDPTVFIERLVEHPRHLEVQIVGDAHGSVAHLFERECSVQRRHQKIIEEAPAVGIDDAVRRGLLDAAVTAGTALHYQGAGTVEFVLDRSGDFFFLEVNTRLQVEHPVTEMVTGIDLVDLQLAIADGEPLPASLATLTPSGHAIEARLYAEDPAQNNLPTTGILRAFSIPESATVRVDAGYVAGQRVSTHYDAMLAKVIVHAETRDRALDKLLAALNAGVIHGVVTNRSLLTGIAAHPDMRASAIDAAYLDRVDLATMISTPHPLLSEAAAVVAVAARRARAQRSRPGLPVGWRNVGPVSQPISCTVAGRTLVVEPPARRGRETWTIDGAEIAMVVLDATPEQVRLSLDGVEVVVAVVAHHSSDGDEIFDVDAPLGESSVTLHSRHRAPARSEARGSLRCPIPGTVSAVAVAVGDTVQAGDLLVTLEAMKMEHAIRAPTAGIVTSLAAAVGDQIDGGAIVAVIESPDPEVVP